MIRLWFQIDIGGTHVSKFTSYTQTDDWSEESFTEEVDPDAHHPRKKSNAFKSPAK